MKHIDSFPGRPMAIITVASLAIIFSVGITSCAYPPMLADADLLEGEAITVLDVTPVSIPIQQGERVITAPGE